MPGPLLVVAILTPFATVPPRSTPPFGLEWPRCQAVAPWPTATASLESQGQTVPAPELEATKVAREPATRRDAVRFRAVALAPTGLAFDAVSERFVIGDGAAHKLMVVSVSGGAPIDMVRADSAGFAGVSAIEIDERRGELWVAGSAGTLHRLQLVSGRPLRTYRPSPNLGGIRLVVLALAASGAVVGLDAERARILILGRGASEWQLSLPVALMRVTSLAIEEEGLVFVAHEGGIARVDLRSHQVSPLLAAPGVELQGLERVRIGTRGLVAIQPTSSGAQRVLLLRLDNAGRRVTRATVIDEEPTPLTGPPSIHLTGRDLYYLTAEAQPGHERPYVVRKLSLP